MVCKDTQLLLIASLIVFITFNGWCSDELLRKRNSKFNIQNSKFKNTRRRRNGFTRFRERGARAGENKKEARAAKIYKINKVSTGTASKTNKIKRA